MQTKEQSLRPGGLVESKDSEEELGVSDDRFDYNRLERYRFLMMGSESPSHAPLANHLQPPRVGKRIDHTGGRLELFNGEISLEIPPGALQEGQVEDITLSVDWNDKHIPPLRRSVMNVAPVVQCGPTGLHFDKQVQLKLPHCAVIPDTKHCKVTIHCSQTKEGESPHWQKIAKPEDSDMAVDCQDGCFILSVRHFCLFTISVNGEESLAKNIMIVGYGPKLRSLEDDQEIRIYLYDDHVSIRDRIHQEEQNLDGKQLDGPVTYQFGKLNQGNMQIEVKDHTSSWQLTLCSQCVEFSFSKMWNSQPWNQCKFTFCTTNKAKEFRCVIQFQQTGNEEVAKLQISNHVKVSSDSSYLPTGSGANGHSTFDAPAPPQAQHAPGIVSFQQRRTSRQDISLIGSTDSGIFQVDGSCTQSASSWFQQEYADGPNGSSIMPRSCRSSFVTQEIIPYAVKRLLCEKLDVIDYALGNDWRVLAASFGYDRCISSWENQRSPTRCIIKAVLQEKRIKSLKDLKDKLQAMNRLDVVEEIENYELRTCDGSTPSIQPASEEPMALGDTPSPDDTIKPLPGSQRFLQLQAPPQPLQVPDQSCPTNGSLSSTDAEPGDSNPNMVQPPCNGAAVTGHMLSTAQPQHHGLDHKSLHSTETGINNCPQTPSPATSQNQPVTNPTASPDSPMNTSGNMTPWREPPSSGTTDENRNEEAVTQGVRRMLWESGESNGC
ncbi:uncharacterized protein LOC119741528 [Patiria miniata]|uniref:Netrin receptor UNC5 n=1 Tax=Patiria miniata TaxID=46514 RepID=A0A914BAM8_PATMI|nr:uncharacterized protein LOC119741528 [Patiria miniata]